MTELGFFLIEHSVKKILMYHRIPVQKYGFGVSCSVIILYR